MYDFLYQKPAHQSLLATRMRTIDLLKAENIEKISGQVIPFAQKTLGGTFSALGNIFLMYLVLYFLLVQTKEVEKSLRTSIPLKSANVKKLIS